MSEKIVVRDLYKIFGPNPERGVELVSEGRCKDDIFRETRNTVAVQDASFEIQEGEIFVVMGLSGSGKSTLVRLLNRLIEPTRGSILVDGEEVTGMSRRRLIELRRRDMAMVFQSFALMPHKNVLDNTAFGLEVSGMGREQRCARALDALEQVGLKDNAASYPDELSGGMQQRVGLARALATDPSIMLMDEAFSALDPLIRTEMQDELLELQRAQARTVVFISHDLDEAIRIGDRIAIMQDGAVVQIGTPEEIVTRPANDYVQSFFYGVDVGQVFTAGDVADTADVTLIERPGMGMRAARERMDQNKRSSAVVLDRDRRYLGTVTADSLSEQISQADDPRYERAFVPGLDPVKPDTPLSEIIAASARTAHPVPVVDSEGRFVGSITRTKLLKVLDRTGRTDQ